MNTLSGHTANTENNQSAVVTVFPWRRFFSRGLDNALYIFYWYMLAYFVIRRNLFPAAVAIAGIIAIIPFTLVYEPLMMKLYGLRYRKTLGIQVVNADGKAPALRQLFKRSWGIISRGYGFFIPIYSIYRMYKSYKYYRENGVTPWDESAGLVTVLKSRHAGRIIEAVLCYAVIGAVLFFIPYVAERPMNDRYFSAEEFNEKLLDYERFHGFASDSVFKTAVLPDTEPPELNFTDRDGWVTGISFEIADGDMGDVWGLENRIRAYVVTFAGVERGINFWDLFLAKDNLIGKVFPDGLWFGWVHSSRHFISHGLEFTYIFKLDGAEDWTESEPDSSVYVYFQLKRV